jgi:tetratricopeptide (TPR) repeat protein
MNSLRRGVTPLAVYRPPCGPVARLLVDATRFPSTLALAWRASRALGRLRGWATTGWRPPLLGISAVGVGLWAVDRWITRLSWLSPWSVLALALIAAIGRAGFQARVRMVVEPFVDQTDTDAGQTEAPGINTFLVSELAALRELYQAVEDRTGVQTATGEGQPVQATLQLEDVGDFLRDAATTDAKLSVGPLVLPVGTVLAMLGRLAQGPRVTGAVQLVRTTGPDGETRQLVTLTAYYAGAKGLASWTVESTLPDNAPPLVHTATMRTMVEELAARMFAHLALGGTSSWRASRRFLEGLRFYRLAHESHHDRTLKLKQAERLFVEALGHDEDLRLARYNIGVVYRELQRDARPEDRERLAKAAEMAFRHEVQRNCTSWEAYYALAQTYFEDCAFDQVPPLCDRVIRLAPTPERKAQAYDLKGLAERRIQYGDADRWLTRAVASRRRAVAYAWLALLRAELLEVNVAAARRLAAHCLLDLGVAVGYARHVMDGDGVVRARRRRRRTFRRCAGLLRLTARLDEIVAPRFELGKIALDCEEPEAAVRELKAAVQIDPTFGECWLQLAEANVQMYERARARHAWEWPEWALMARNAVQRAREHLDSTQLEVESLQSVTEALATPLERIGDFDEAAALRRVPTVVGAVANLDDDLDELEQLLETETDSWSRGHIAMRLGTLHNDAGRDQEAEWWLKQAGDCWAEYPEEMRRRGLQGILARVLARQGKQQDALRVAHAAIGVDPISWWEREVLGDVYEAAGDLQSAVDAYEHALLWHPNNPGLHRKLGTCHWRIAGDQTRPAGRTAGYRRALEHNKAVLDLLSPSDFHGRVAANYWLGRAYAQAGEYERAIPHLRNALAAGESAPVVETFLGEAYLQMHGYSQAEEVLSKAIDAGDALAADDARKTIGDELGDTWEVGALAAQGHLLLALALIDRDVRFGEARGHTKTAASLSDLVGETGDSTLARVRELQGRILLREDRVDAAISALENSVAISADAEAYVYLARAYAAKAIVLRTKRDRRRLAEQARRACGHAIELDTTLEYRDVIETVAMALAAEFAEAANGAYTSPGDGHESTRADPVA